VPETHLFLPDQHFPFADWDAISVAHAIGRDAKPDHVWLGGDTVDFSALGKFADAQVLELYQHNLQDEIDQANDYLRMLVKDFPDAEIAYFKANHEWRLSKYVPAHARAFEHLRALKFEKLLDFDELGIEVVGGRVYLARQNVVLKHGSRFGVHAAKNELMDEGRSGMSGHNHKTQTATKNYPDMSPKVWESVGCLCSLRPPYKEHDGKASGWNQGFGIIYVDGADYAMDNVVIDRGVAYWRGTRYST
jgi:hypothetical protein